MNTELPAFQQNVETFVEAYGLKAPIHARALDLTSEVGELAKEILKGTGYGRRHFEPPHGWDDELGDVLFALICLANSTGVDLEAALAGALHKYQERLGSEHDAGSGR